MSCENEVATALRRRGRKATPQRLTIACALRHAGGHVTAGEIAEVVHGEHPTIDVSTVYRTLDMLCETRLATSTDMGTGDAVFEWAGGDEPHHHLICVRCGPVAELPHEYLDRMESSIERDFGFVPDLSHFAIFGVCTDCRPDREPEEQYADKA